ncbi:MAG TPA: L-histidine N(alpha)-methyltransferase [Acidobacteriaceae bacterium]|nr:L-histidine N(alpha)-methyltransferase [Acidobacteriaceae bacterium]
MLEATEAAREALQPDTDLRNAMLAEALEGLAVPAGKQKTLPPWLFYDEAGSALFEKITELPEYYLTRAERSIFAERGDEVVTSVGCPLTVAELGSGTASKTGLLLGAAAKRQPELLYQPIDISNAALEQAASAIPAAVSGVQVRPQLSNYITNGYTIERPGDCCVLALYIGSSIGNFGPDEARSILRKLRKHVKKIGDAVLLGVDLAPNRDKSVEQLIAAYDDAAGVTAEFNKNILARLNRELGSDFNLDNFRHRAVWNPQESRMEMHLESTVPQTVHIGDQEIIFAPGESIHTENSYKFTERGLRELLHDCGFGSPQWFEDADHHFAVALAYPV